MNLQIIQVNFSTIFKNLRYIKSVFGFDAHLSAQIAPFGDDSCPLNSTKGVKSKTDDNATHVILGYFNRNPLAQEGEKRLYSKRPAGEDSFVVWLKNDGTLEMGGTSDFMVRFSELKKGFDKLVEAHNGLVDKYNLHTHPVSGANTLITTGIEIPSTANINACKIEQIKTL